MLDDTSLPGLGAHAGLGALAGLGAHGRVENAGIIPGPRPADRRESFDPWRLARLIRRQWSLMLIVLFAVNGLALAVILHLSPIYRSTALLVVEPHPVSLLDAERYAGPQPADGAQVDGEVEILRSPALLLSVVQALDLTRDPDFSWQPTWRDGVVRLFTRRPAQADDAQAFALKRLQRVVSINRRGDTHIIAVDGRSTKPDDAARLANATANASISAQTSAKVTLAADVERRLLQQLQAARTSLRDMDGRLDTFLDDNIRQIEDVYLRSELAELRAGIKESADTHQRFATLVDRSRDRAQQSNWPALIEELSSDKLAVLIEQRETARIELAEADRPPAVRDLRTRLGEIDHQLQAEAQVVIDRVAAEADHAGSREAALRQRLSRRLADQDIPTDLVLHFREVEGETEALRSVVERLTTNAKWAAAQSDLQLPDSRIVAPALPSTDPVYPEKRLLLSISGFLSLILALGVGITRDRTGGGFKDAAHIEAVTGRNAVASLPEIGRRPELGPDDRQRAAEILDNPSSRFSEAIRRLALDIEIAADREQAGRTIVVTSVARGEGKTLVALALARALGLAGLKTLLVDANSRHPGVLATAGVDLVRPARTALRQTPTSALEPVIPDLAPNVDLVALSTTGAMRRPADLGALRETFGAYRFVIIDSAAIDERIGTEQLIRQCDDVMLVIRARATGQPQITRALADIVRLMNSGGALSCLINFARLR